MAPTSKKKIDNTTNSHKHHRTVKHPSVTYFLRSRNKTSTSRSSPHETDALSSQPVLVEPTGSISSETSVTSVEIASTSNTISSVPEKEPTLPLSSFPSSISYSLESAYKISMPLLNDAHSTSVSSAESNETASVKVALLPLNYEQVVSASDMMASTSGNSVGTSSMPLLNDAHSTSVSSAESNETASVKVALSPFNYEQVVSASDMMASTSGNSVGTSSMPLLNDAHSTSVSSAESNETASVKVALSPFNYEQVVSASDMMASTSGNSVGTSSMPLLNDAHSTSVSSAECNETASVKVALAPFNYEQVASASDMMASTSGNSVGNSSMPLLNDAHSTSVSSAESNETASVKVALSPFNYEQVVSASDMMASTSGNSVGTSSMPLLNDAHSTSVSSAESNETASVKVALSPFNYEQVVSGSDMMPSTSSNSVGTSSTPSVTAHSLINSPSHLSSESNEDTLRLQPISSSMSVIEPLTSEALSSSSLSMTKSPNIESSVSSGKAASCAKLLHVNSKPSASVSKLPINRSSKANLPTVKVKSSIKAKSSYVKAQSSTAKAKSIASNAKKSSIRGKSSFSSKLSKRYIKNKSVTCAAASSTSKGKSTICSTKLPVVSDQPIPSTSKVPTDSSSEIKPSTSTGKSSSYRDKLRTSSSQPITSTSDLPMDTSNETESSTSSSELSKSSNKVKSVICPATSSILKGKSTICNTKFPVISDQPIPSTSKIPSDSSSEIKQSTSKGKSNNYRDKLRTSSSQPVASTSELPMDTSSQTESSTSSSKLSKSPNKAKSVTCAATSSISKGKSTICSTKLPVVSDEPIPSTSKIPSGSSSEIKPSTSKGKSNNYRDKLRTSSSQPVASTSELPMDTSSQTESSTSSSKLSKSPNKAKSVTCAATSSISKGKSTICSTKLPVVSDQPIPSTSKVPTDSSSEIKPSTSIGKSSSYRDKLRTSNSQPIASTSKVPSDSSSEIKPSTSKGKSSNYRDKLHTSSSKPIASTSKVPSDSSNEIKPSTSKGESSNYRDKLRVSRSERIASRSNYPGDSDSSTSTSTEAESTDSETYKPSTPKKCSKKRSPPPPSDPWLKDFFRPGIMESRYDFEKRMEREPPLKPLPPPTTRMFKLLQGRELGRINDYHFPQNFMQARVTNYSKRVSYGFSNNSERIHTVYFVRGGETALVAVWFVLSPRSRCTRAVGQLYYDMSRNIPGRIGYITTSRAIHDACQINSESFACIGNDVTQQVGVLHIASPGPPGTPYNLSEFHHNRGYGNKFNCCNSNMSIEQVAVGCDKEIFFYNVNGLIKTITLNDNVCGLAFNQAGNFLYYTCDKGQMVELDLQHGQYGHRARIANEVLDEVILLEDENYCVVSGPSGFLSRVDNRMSRVVLRYDGNFPMGMKLPLSVNNKFGLLSCTGFDDVTRVWNLNTGRPLFCFKGPTTYSSRSCLVPRSHKGSIYLIQDDVLNIYSTVK